ncbi:MAG: hypothetical protein EOO99_11680 [Pedobacter sp.]|nr:MAG: hypothetical protein EOO99_11680 [Pedobacter sp.]
MTSLGKYQNREILWVDYSSYKSAFPNNDWLCLAVANSNPNWENFEDFIRISIAQNILEFKGCGLFGEKLYDRFDEVMNIMEVIENHNDIEVITTWHNNETLADTFWQCFFATSLPETTDFENIKIVCVDLDGVDRRNELQNYIQKFEWGWIPE